MRFAKSRLYIEAYIKCPNCGILIFESSKHNTPDTKTKDGKLYCSSWCVDWEADREARRHAEANAT